LSVFQRHGFEAAAVVGEVIAPDGEPSLRLR
jgi:hypothetical protein